MSAPVIQITKLDENNYDSWSLLMKSVLIHSGHWKIVSGQVKNESTDAAEKAKWESDDEKALASIYLGVQPSQLGYIRDCKTSNVAWEKLKEVYMPKGPMQKVSLYKKLVNLALAPGGDVVQHLNEFTEVCGRLAEIGIDIGDELLVIVLMSSLPTEYENFVIAIETRDSLPSLAVLKQKLLEEGKRRKEKDESIVTPSSNGQQQAFAAKSNSKNEKKAKNNKKAFQGKCFVCGGVGHYASKCEHKNKNAQTHVKSNSQALASLAAADCKAINSKDWYIDSGATAHMCNDRGLFVRFEEHNEIITLAGNKFINAVGKGDVIIHNHHFELKLHNVLFSPKLQANFISVNKCVERGLVATFDKSKAQICRMSGEVVLVAQRKNNMFVAQNEVPSQMVCTAKSSMNAVWHNRFGHLNNKSLHDLSNKGMVKGMEINADHQSSCNTCMLSKIHVLSFPKESQTITKELLEIVHADVCGPFRVKSIGGASYFLTFIDDMSRRTYVYFLKNKSEVFEKFKLYKAQVERQTGFKIKTLRTDNGCEFVNNNFNHFLAAEGIQRQLTVPHTPQQNGVAERANRTIIEMARSMIIHAGVKHYLWAEAVNTAVYIRNRCPTKKLENKTPYEIWSGVKPNAAHMKVFGCSAVGMNKAANKSKFDAKGSQYIMVGYSTSSKAYRLFDTNTHKVVEKRDVLFDENLFPSRNERNETDRIVSNDDWFFHEVPQQCVDDNDNETIECVSNAIENIVNVGDVLNDCEGQYSTQDESFIAADDDDNSKGEEPHARGRPKIIRTGLPGRPKKVFCKKSNELCVAMDESVPQTVDEALSSKSKKFWERAMHEEFDALQKNKTWSLVDLPKGQKAIPCKWVYALKKDVNGDIERYKARLVAKGCNQQYGINFKETFSPVVRYSTIRLLLALAVQRKMHLHQIDVSTAYLNSRLHEEVYMKQPPYFCDSSSPNKVLRLHKALYGLKQSGKEWNDQLDGVLGKMKFKACKYEPCLYQATFDGNLALIAVYVDDLIIGCSDLAVVLDVKRKLANEFQVNDKGKLNHFLGMEVQREGDTGAIKLSQSQYIRDMLEQYGMQQCKAVAVPLDPGYQVHCEEECEKVSQHEYQSLIGSMMYLAISTRPDILYSVSKMAQRNADPHIEHYQMLKRILRYLAGTVELKLIYKTSENGLEGFVDADWAGNSTDRKSYTGFTFFYGNNLVSWESRKQSSVALSSTEAEYMAASAAAKEAIYLKRLLQELGEISDDPVVLHIDNQGALKLAENPVYHQRSKHIDIRFHHIRELVQSHQVKLEYCPTDEMPADILTKNLAKNKHCRFVSKLKLNCL